MVPWRRFLSLVVVGALSAVMFTGQTGPVHGQDLDGFQETFSSAHPAQWGLYHNASISDGVLRVQNDGTSGREGRWGNQTLTLRMRLTAGAVAIHYRHNQDHSYMVVIRTESVTVQRRMEGGHPSLELGRADSIAVPRNRWFELSITSLGSAHVVGIDEVEVLTAFDPNGELPPGGVLFHAWGETRLDVDDVTLTPWFVEDFERPLGSGWGEATVMNGALQLPPHTWIAYGGDTWGDMTYIVQVRQSGQGRSGFTYHLRGQTTYMVGFSGNTVSVRRELDGAGGDIASAAVSGTSPDGWRWLSVTVKGAQQVVQLDGRVVLAVADPDPLPPGIIALESGDSCVEVGWLAVGPPMPLPQSVSVSEPPPVQPAPPAAPQPTSSSSQPTAQPQPTEPPPPPGGGEWGILKTDIAVTDVFVDSMPFGTVHFRLTNHGPGTLSNVDVLVGCSSVMTELATGAQLSQTTTPSSYSVSLSPGQTQTFASHLELDTQLFSPTFTCTAQPDFDDPNGGNNSLSEFVSGGADLSLDEMYACGQPPEFWVSVSNHGPLNLPDPWLVSCTVTANCGGDTACSIFPIIQSFTSMPMVGRGGGYSLGTGADFSQYSSFHMTCTLGTAFDPNLTNNTWSGTVDKADCIRYAQ
jgi:hypothetical protein